MITIEALQLTILFRKRLTSILITTCFCFSVVSSAWAEDKDELVLRYNLIGSESWTSYGYLGDDTRPGAFAEIMELILKRSEISYKFFYYPPKRASKEFEQGELDIDFMSPSWFKDKNMGEEFVHSDKIFELTEYVVTLQKNAKKYQDPKQIYGKRIGTVAGYSYHDDDKFTRVDFSSESALVKGLKKGRFEAVILEELTAKHWAKEHNANIALASVHTHGDIVLRLRAQLKHLLPTLNAAIAALEREGEIDKILKDYNIR